jgi:uncharacterized protein YjiS (DUF1127 family)
VPPSILVWHEDRNPAPLIRVLRHVFRHDVQLDVPNPSFAGPIRAGNAWRSQRSHHEHLRVKLRRLLADQLLKPEGFVLFHFDGDRPWSRRSESTTTRQFEEHVRAQVITMLSSYNIREAFVRERMHTLVPFYSLEAWIYQNTDTAIALCSASCSQEQRAKHRPNWIKYSEDRSLLDELDRPKDTLCLGDNHNQELADGFPWRDVLGARTSFLESVMGLMQSAPLSQYIRPRVVDEVRKLRAELS